MKKHVRFAKDWNEYRQGQKAELDQDLAFQLMKKNIVVPLPSDVERTVLNDPAKESR